MYLYDQDCEKIYLLIRRQLYAWWGFNRWRGKVGHIIFIISIKFYSMCDDNVGLISILCDKSA